MGWFEEQLNYKRKKDEESFVSAIESVADAVMGKKLVEALEADEIAGSAIEEILKFYHCKPQNTDLPPQVKGVEDQLEYRLRPFGIMRRKVTLEEGWYKNSVGAMLGTLKADGSAVALIPGKFYGYSFVDIKSGKRIKLSKATAGLLDTEAVCFYKPLPLKKLTVRDLLIFMAQQFSVSDIVLYFGMMAASAALGLLSPLFTKWLFGTVLESKDKTVLLALAGFMVCYTLSKLLFDVFRGIINSRISAKQNIAVQAAVMSRVMSLPASFFKDYSAGELNRRVAYVQQLCSIMMNSVGTVGFTSLFSLIYIGQIFAFAPALVVPSLAVTALSALLSVITAIVQTGITKEEMLLSSETSGLTYSTITGIQKIKLAGAQKRMFSRWARQYAKEASVTYNPPLFLRISPAISLAVSLFGTLLLYGIAVKSSVSVADYYAFNASYAMVSGGFMSFASIVTGLASINPTLNMAKPIMEAQPEISEGLEIVTQLNGSIELSRVSFSYEPGQPNVIDDLSLKIKPGEYVAVVGATGCGKSTLLRLLLGFEKPQKGAIYYDRKDMTRLDLKSLRRSIGTVMQDGKLFMGDIYSNIVISAPHLTLDEAWKAAETAAVADDIRAMPMGMHTVISEGQGGISGGQKQRIMIARAVAPSPKILMFDEATSALDNITQKKVSDAIDSLNCTRIVIAHRLSTIRSADRILFLNNGKIAEEGTYEELINKNGLFAELVERQRLDI